MRASSTTGNKSGFFSYLKGLFRRNDSYEDADYGFEETTITAQPTAKVAPPVEVAAPAPVANTRATSSAQVQPDVDRDRQDGGIAPTVSLPLQPIIDGLPAELRRQVMVSKVGDLTISLPIDKILAQLSQGQIRVPFGDIRSLVPHVFALNTEYDRISVGLPLGEVLPRLNPALLLRRPTSRQVEVPEDIASPFSGRGKGLSVGNAKSVQPPAAPQRPAPAPGPIAPARGATPPQPRAQLDPAVAEIPAPFPFAAAAPRSAAAPAPTARVTPSAPIPFAPQSRPAPAQPVAPAAPVTPAASPIPMRQSPMVPAAPAAKATTPGASSAVIQVPLNSLSETWNEGVLEEIQQNGLSSSKVALPVDLVEGGLKRGRVTFNWRTVRSWITPAAPTSVSTHDNVELDLPLKVIAPLFLARKSTGASVNRAALDESIPNPFAGPARAEAAGSAQVTPPAPFAPPRPAAAPTPAAKPAPVPFAQTPPPAPAPKPNPVAPASLAPASPSIPFKPAPLPGATTAPKAAAPKTPAPALDTNYYLWENASETKLMHIEALKRKGASGTEFTKRYSSPNEIVSQAVTFDGVTGALIALPDGLMVASRIPPEYNGDTLAAFLPQIYAKVSSCTKELRMGELNNVGFTVGNVPWKIFRVNAIFFAAFGEAGRSMPTAELASLAGGLDRKGNK